MRAVNCSNQKVLVEHLTIAHTFFRRLKGLLGTSALAQGDGLLIQPCNSVHTFLMSYPIDVLFLDSSCQIVKIAEVMEPGRVAVATHSSSVLELPAGTVAATATRVGDQILVELDSMKE